MDVARKQSGNSGNLVPDHWQICQLAALVSDNLPEGRDGALKLDALRRVALAVEIWWESQKAVEILNEAFSGISSSESDPRLAGPLKVGNHFLPRLPDWGCEDGVIEFEEYLKPVLGLSKPADRMRWWRAFMDHEMKLLASRALLAQAGGPAMASKLEGLPWDSPLLKGIVRQLSVEVLAGEDLGASRYSSELVANRISTQRESGIKLGSEGFQLALRFRRWRLGMKTSDQVATESADLEECVRRGLEAERKGQ